MTSHPSNQRDLCLALMKADTEAEVIQLLHDAGYWDDPNAWRWLGDEEYNYSTVGNQQSRAEQAIVEKLVNSIDAKLMSEARLHGFLPKTGSEPQGAGTPTSIQEAREKFFSQQLKDPEALSRGITVAATAPGLPTQGFKRPCFSIADDGEGQTPTRMPKTILSLLAGNKEKIKFAQGKFNMGGTGVLAFCGLDRNLQFVMSRRHPELIDERVGEPSNNDWSFTIIRREDPVDGKSSRFVYLAPVGAGKNPNHGELLHFAAETMPIFPDKNQAYVRESRWGTLIKLYEFDAMGFRTGMMFEGGLMFRTRIMLPEPALPIRFHECRPFRGKSASYDTTMPGLIATLKNDMANPKRDNVEWHDELAFDIDGEPFTAKIFLFKDKKAAENYKSDEGVVFTYNGQCHATMTKDFFRRKKVNKDYLWHCLLVFVDCSAISTRGHEMLFMNGRDRLRNQEFKSKLEAQLEEEIGGHDELRELANARRKKEASESPAATETMAKTIERLLSRNKALAALLGQGLRIKNPHKPEGAGVGVVGFIGKRFPTKFHIKGHDPVQVYARDAHINAKVRLSFETDASNEYFKRDEEPGDFALYRLKDGEREPAKNFSRPKLQDGLARMSLDLPEEVAVGATLTFVAEINDPSRLEPFVNEITLTVKEERKTLPGTTGEPLKGGGAKGESKGPNDDDGAESKDSLLGIPNPIPVEHKDWENQDPPFNKFTALKIVRHPEAKEDEDRFDYYVNMSNGYLTGLISENPKQAAVMKKRFSIGMTLVALSLLHQEQLRRKATKKSEEMPDDESSVVDRVTQVTAALAPFILPMVEALSDPDLLEEDDEPLSASAGEAA